MSEFDGDALVRADVAAMEPYTPVVPFEVLSQQLGRAPEEIVKLNANENPYGPSPRVARALAGGQYYHIYPDPASNLLRDALAEFTGVPKELLMAGAGADELIDLVLRVILNPGDVVLNCPPSFGMYPFSTAVNGGRLVEIPRNADFSIDSGAVAATVAAEPRARAIFACSPNNPDGSTISDTELKHLLSQPLLVILDEAYVEFAGESRIRWVEQYPNLVVLRTFSKLAGLAGLRVGYMAGPPWLLPHIWKIKQPYNVNVAATLAALASLEDQAWLDEKVAAIVEQRERLFIELAEFDFLCPYPSRSNFVLCRVQDIEARDIVEHLEERGILIRYYDKPGLADCIRISAGRPRDTDRLMEALRELEDV